MRTAIIDGDEIAYKIASTYQKKFYGVYRNGDRLYFTPDKLDAIEFIENSEDLDLIPEIIINKCTGFESRFKSTIDSILENTNSSKYKICVSGQNNFRYSIATIKPYKGNRDPENKPGYFPNFIKYLLEEEKAEQVDFLEADDLLVYNYLQEKDAVICSTDKDLRTVSSLNFNISTKFLQFIPEEIALYNFYIQLLIGDSTDNIPSPYGLGEVNAGKILKECKGKTEEYYYQTIYPYYMKYLVQVDKEGNYKTKWFDEHNGHDVLWEVGNLIWMHRTLDPNERWKLPVVEGLIDG